MSIAGKEQKFDRVFHRYWISIGGVKSWVQGLMFRKLRIEEGKRIIEKPLWEIRRWGEGSQCKSYRAKGAT